MSDKTLLDTLKKAIFAIPDEYLISRDIIIHAITKAISAANTEPESTVHPNWQKWYDEDYNDGKEVAPRKTASTAQPAFDMERMKKALLQITIEGPGRAVEIATKALSEANAAYEASTAQPNTAERKRIIAEAIAWNGGRWPNHLSSGVMFFKGERITRNEFLAALAQKGQQNER